MASFENRSFLPERRVLGIDALTLARGLGWFSVGLGLAELLAPRFLARKLGLKDRSRLVAGYGVREIATGVAILSVQDPTPWIWSRVGGDGLDLATLAFPLFGSATRKGNAAVGLVAVLGITALDVLCARALSAR